MVRVTTKNKRKTRKVYGLVFLIFLSAAAGVGLYRLSPSLLDIGRSFRHAADKILEQSADNVSAEPVLRGTVFDRDFNELAVSYRLYSLYVRPAEITDGEDVVRILSDVTGQDPSELHARLGEAKSIISVADHLEQPQVDMIKNAGLSGIYVKPVEERFYPKHETAASLVGFTGKGIGLSGVEGVFDMLLQEGEFLTDTVQGINFSEEKVLGRGKVDIVLTVDLALQGHVEKQLRAFMDRSGSTRGIALLMHPKSGEILAWASQPSFNPNYYWRVPDPSRKSLFEENLDPGLFHDLLVYAAAIEKEGDSGEFQLPQTVAASNYGLSAEEIERFRMHVFQSSDKQCSVPSCGPMALEGYSEGGEEDEQGNSPVELTAAVASLLNGGKFVAPHVLDAVYDHTRENVFAQSQGKEVPDRAFSPSMGIRVRHTMFSSADGSKDGMILRADSVHRVRKQGIYSEYVMQDAMFAALPAKSPEMLLFVATQREDLNPVSRKQDQPHVSMTDFGKDLLASVSRMEKKRAPVEQLVAARIPKERDKANYNQFLISSRIDLQEAGGKGPGRVAVMPQLVGLSLRKGLQRLNEYDLQVKIQGSGQIVSQFPRPGEPLQGVGECVLTLASEI